MQRFPSHTPRLIRCPHCSGLHLPGKTAGAVRPHRRQPATPFPDFLAELRRNFRYDAPSEQPLPRAAGS